MIAWVATIDSFIYCSELQVDAGRGPNGICKECNQPARDHDDYDYFMKYALPFDDMWDVKDYGKGASLV